MDWSGVRSNRIGPALDSLILSRNLTANRSHFAGLRSKFPPKSRPIVMQRITVYRLEERSQKDGTCRGLSCDESGIFYGDFPIVSADEVTNQPRYRVTPIHEINFALSMAFRTQIDFADRKRGLQRAAVAMSKGDWTTAKIVTLNLRLPASLSNDELSGLRKAGELLNKRKS